MVSGLYRAFIDDSGRGQEPAFVLAGYLATPEQWEKFSDDWANALQSVRPLEYFKMREAIALEEQFYNWSAPERDKLLSTLVNIIDNNVVTGVCNVVPNIYWRALFKNRFSTKMNNPYGMSYHGIISAAYSFQWHAGTSYKIEFIFDEHRNDIRNIHAVWEQHRLNSHPKVKPMIGNKPQSGDDKKLLQLQAADMLAWRMRKYVEDNPNIQSGFSTIPSPFGNSSVRVSYWSKARLERTIWFLNLMKFVTGDKWLYEMNRKERRKVMKAAARRIYDDDLG
jgi:hypothetical protein